MRDSLRVTRIVSSIVITIVTNNSIKQCLSPKNTIDILCNNFYGNGIIRANKFHDRICLYQCFLLITTTVYFIHVYYFVYKLFWQKNIIYIASFFKKRCNFFITKPCNTTANSSNKKD